MRPNPERDDGSKVAAPRRPWGALALVGCAIVAGAWLRKALAASSGLWRDEAQSLAIAQLPTLRELFSFLTREESHPPLFYLLERAWVGMFGASDPAVVGLGLLPGVLVIPAAGWIAWQFSGSRAGVLAAWFTALAVPLVWQSTDARPYAFLSLVTLLTAAAGLFAVRRPGVTWVAYAVGCLTLLYTHNWWVLAVTALAIVTFLASWKAHQGRGPWLYRWVAAHAMVLVLALPWAPVLLAQNRASGYAARMHFPFEWLLVTPLTLIGITLPLVVPAAALIGLGQYRIGVDKRRREIVVYFSIVAVLPCVFALVSWKVANLTLYHCAASMSPLFLVALASGLGSGGRPGVRFRQNLTGALLTGLLALATWTRWFPKSNIREAAIAISAHAAAGDLVLLYPASIGPVFERYFGASSSLAVYPIQSSISPTRFRGWWRRFDDPADLAPLIRLADETCQAGKTVWLVSQVWRNWDSGGAAREGTVDRFRYNVGTRRAELRSELHARFGRPTSPAMPALVTRRRELVEVERYVRPTVGNDSLSDDEIGPESARSVGCQPGHRPQPAH